MITSVLLSVSAVAWVQHLLASLTLRCCFIICLVWFLAAGPAAWRDPQRQQLTPQQPPAPTPRWSSPTSRTHTHPPPPSPAATTSMQPTSPTAGTGWASSRWAGCVPHLLMQQWIEGQTWICKTSPFTGGLEHNKRLPHLCVGGAVSGCSRTRINDHAGCVQGWGTVLVSLQVKLFSCVCNVRTLWSSDV